jgi:dihydroorotate dehydrogenase
VIHRGLVRPLLFRLDPERAHTLAIATLGVLARTPPVGALIERRLRVDDPRLHQELWGLQFSNPVGLGAGFDKQAHAVPAWANLGFGFAEIGTVTAVRQPGNPKPRVFRLPDERGLINRLGFNSDGADTVAERLKRWERAGRAHRIPLGINIGKTKVAEDAAADYVATFSRVAAYADYVTINVSSPNTPGLRDLQERNALETLVTRIAAANRVNELRKPILVKIAPDLDQAALEAIVAIARDRGVDGLIVSNTTVGREGVASPLAAEAGGLSGAPLRDLSDDVLRRVHLLAGGLPIVGVGGVFTGADAWRKILAGASLVQIYTRFVYEGAGLPRRINEDLLLLCEQAGVRSLDEAVGQATGPASRA